MYYNSVDIYYVFIISEGLNFDCFWIRNGYYNIICKEKKLLRCKKKNNKENKLIIK